MNTKKVNASEEELIQRRKIRNGKYVYEDYLTAISKAKRVGYACLFLGIFYLINSLLMGGQSLPHALCSLFLGAGVLLVYQLLPFEKHQVIVPVTGVYLLMVFLEYLFFGMPSSLIPGLGEVGNYKYINVVTIANDFTPFLYFVLKFCLSFLFIYVVTTEQKVNALPKDIKIALGIKYK